MTMDSYSKAVMTVIAVALVGCSEGGGGYEAGYDDGLAVGYNTECEIRTTLIEGNFDNASYARGYAEGQAAGIIACNNDRAAGRVR